MIALKIAFRVYSKRVRSKIPLKSAKRSCFVIVRKSFCTSAPGNGEKIWESQDRNLCIRYYRKNIQTVPKLRDAVKHDLENTFFGAQGKEIVVAPWQLPQHFCDYTMNKLSWLFLLDNHNDNFLGQYAWNENTVPMSHVFRGMDDILENPNEKVKLWETKQVTIHPSQRGKKLSGIIRQFGNQFEQDFYNDGDATKGLSWSMIQHKNIASSKVRAKYSNLGAVCNLGRPTLFRNLKKIKKTNEWNGFKFSMVQPRDLRNEQNALLREEVVAFMKKSNNNKIMLDCFDYNGNDLYIDVDNDLYPIHILRSPNGEISGVAQSWVLNIKFNFPYGNSIMGLIPNSGVKQPLKTVNLSSYMIYPGGYVEPNDSYVQAVIQLFQQVLLYHEATNGGVMTDTRDVMYEKVFGHISFFEKARLLGIAGALAGEKDGEAKLYLNAQGFNDQELELLKKTKYKIFMPM